MRQAYSRYDGQQFTSIVHVLSPVLSPVFEHRGRIPRPSFVKSLEKIFSLHSERLEKGGSSKNNLRL
jgi:hypothetical protein